MRMLWLSVIVLYICRIVTDIPGTTDASFGRYFLCFVLSLFLVLVVLRVHKHAFFRARSHKLREPKTKHWYPQVHFCALQAEG